MRSLLVLVAASLTQLIAATGGAPTAPGPGPVPKWCLTDINDNAFARKADDDHRTNEVDLVFRAYGGLISLSHAMLTDYKDGVRTDEASVMYGYEIKFDSAWSITSLGARFTGDVLGQPIQNTFHRAIGQRDAIYHLRTERDGPSWVISQEIGYMEQTAEHAGVACKARCAIDTNKTTDADLSGHLFFLMGPIKLFVGLKEVLNYCNSDLISRRSARNFERGEYVDIALQCKYFDIGASYKISDQYSFGYVSIRKGF